LASQSPDDLAEQAGTLLDTEGQVELIPIQPKGSQIPLYLVHELYGEVDCYEALSRLLGADQPIYGFRSLMHGRDRTIEELAALYLRHLRAFDPVGPYILGGYSLGGQIAFEMARQLWLDGCQPKLVCLFDSWILGSRTRLGWREQGRVLLQNAKISGVPYVMRKIENKWNHWNRVPKRIALRAISFFYERFNLAKPREIIRAEIETRHRKALLRYQPGAYHGPVFLLVAEQRHQLTGWRGDPFHGWGALANTGLEISSIPADHEAFLQEPNVQIIARALRNRLDTRNDHQTEARK
jgi:thioesterase domain-containing protein